MIDFFNDIGNLIQTIGGFIVSFFTNIIEIVQLVFKGSVLANEVLLLMPIQYQVVLIAILAYVIIVTIIHFGG